MHRKCEKLQNTSIPPYSKLYANLKWILNNFIAVYSYNLHHSPLSIAACDASIVVLAARVARSS